MFKEQKRGQHGQRGVRKNRAGRRGTGEAGRGQTVTNLQASRGSFDFSRRAMWHCLSSWNLLGAFLLLPLHTMVLPSV